MVDPVTISTFAGIAKGLISRIWPDPVEQAKQVAILAEIEQRGDLAELNAHVTLLQGQLAINLKEAEHPSLFVSGWRPSIGWVGSAAMAYQFVVYPFLIWVWASLKAAGYIHDDLSPPPVIDTAALFAMVSSMLGIGVMRSHDKAKGVDTRRSK